MDFQAPLSKNQRPCLFQHPLWTTWRGVALLNILLAVACAITLLICLLVSMSHDNSSLYGSTMMFLGSCSEAGRINMALHLLLNLLSSLVFASSNYFMQILNAPSRQEIDKAHLQLQSLDLGVPSLKNLRYSKSVQTFGLGTILAQLGSDPPSIQQLYLQNSSSRLTVANDYRYRIIVRANCDICTGSQSSSCWITWAHLCLQLVKRRPRMVFVNPVNPRKWVLLCIDGCDGPSNWLR